MKNIINSIFAFLIITFPTTTFAQSWQWGLSGYGGEGVNCTVDHAGYVYTVGYIGETVILGHDTIDKSASTCEMDVSKYDASGNIQWAWSPENGFTFPFAISTDAYSNVYILGYYSGTVTAGPDTLINPDTSLSIYKYFITKLNPSGVAIWSKNLGTASTNDTLQDNGDFGDLEVDASGNIIVTCSFSDNPILGSFTFANHDTTLMTQDILFARLDSGGNTLWATTFGNLGNDAPAALSISSAGNIYLAGNYTSDTLLIGSLPIVNGDSSIGRSAIFLAKMDSVCTPLWVRQPTGTYENEVVMDVVADEADCAYITGYFNDIAINFGGLPVPSSTPGAQNGFLAKYKSSGGIQWVKGLYGHMIRPWSLEIDACNNSVWLSGEIYPFYTDSIDGRAIVAPAGSIDPVFIVGWRADSTLITITTLASGGDDWMGIACDDTGNIYFTSDLQIDSLVFGLDTIICPHLASIGEYFILAKFQSGDSCSTSGITKQDVGGANSFVLYPSPVNSILNIAGIETINSVCITDLYGRQVYATNCNANEVQLNVADYPVGVYIVRVNEHIYREFVKE